MRPNSLRIPAWLADAVLIIVLALGVLALRASGALPPDVTYPANPYAPGAPDVAARTVG